jgi:hypothetical protein
LSFTKALDESSFVGFSTDGTLVYIETGANGSPRSTSPRYLKLPFVGSKIVCQDAIPWGDEDELLVVACISVNVMASSNTIWL